MKGMKKLIFIVVFIVVAVVSYSSLKKDEVGLSFVDRVAMDYKVALPPQIPFLEYEKVPNLPIESWINSHATELNAKGFDVETPVLMRTVPDQDLTQCAKDNSQPPCTWVLCKKIAENETTLQYRCGRFGVTQYFMTNKDSSKIVILKSFGKEPSMTAEEVLTAVSFK